MRYYKLIENGYITAIGTGGGGIEIPESDYTNILHILQTKPPRTIFVDYRLKENLEWEEYSRPADPVYDEIDEHEFLNILLGIEEEE